MIYITYIYIYIILFIECWVALRFLVAAVCGFPLNFQAEALAFRNQCGLHQVELKDLMICAAVSWPNPGSWM